MSAETSQPKKKQNKTENTKEDRSRHRIRHWRHYFRQFQLIVYNRISACFVKVIHKRERNELFSDEIKIDQRIRTDSEMILILFVYLFFVSIVK